MVKWSNDFCFSRQMKSPAITTTLEGKNKTLYLQVTYKQRTFYPKIQ